MFQVVIVGLSTRRTLRPGLVHGDAHARIGTAVIEEPPPVVQHQPLDEDRSGGILPAALEIGFGNEEGLVEPPLQPRGIGRVEERLPGAVGPGGIRAVAALPGGVLAVGAWRAR